MIRVALTGGGTGGHFYPLIALSEEIHQLQHEQKLSEVELYYFGPEPYDAGALYAEHIEHQRVPAGKFRRYASVANILDLFKVALGFFVAVWKLFVLYPDVIVSKGGFATVPIVLAGKVLGIPIVVHESDSKPGRANALAARFARTVAISYPSAATYFKNANVITTGIPIRRALLEQSAASLQQTFGFTANRPVILIIGGSQGAERINNAVITALDTLLPQYAIIHQTGEDNLETAKQSATALTQDASLLAQYHPYSFLDAAHLHSAYAAASVVISRAGSTSIAEIALHEKPAILIPIPESISHDQRQNAYEYARSGAATVIEEKNLTPHLLAAEIERIMADTELADTMRTAAAAFAPRDAARTLASVVLDIAKEH